MTNTIVFYYSRNGSNRFLAHRIARDLHCEIEEIKPRIKSFIFILMGINIGNRKLKSRVENYDRVILCGPIFTGKLIVPLRNFISKYRTKINELIFVTCCGSPFEMKDERFGHNRVFNVVRNLAGEKCIHCEAFPITLILTEEQKKDPEAVLKYHLNEENFTGEILDLYHRFISTLR